MAEITYPVPIQFPLELCDGKFPQKIHNMNNNLVNPFPFEDWKPGDTCWYYDKTDKCFHYGVVKEIDATAFGDSFHLFIYPLCGESISTVLLSNKEAFPTLEDAKRAFFHLM